MEHIPNSPSLYLINLERPERLPCQGNVYIEEVVLSLDCRSEVIDVEVDLLYCETPEGWYGPLQALEGLLAELAWGLDEVTMFLVDDEPVEVFVLPQLNADPIPWEAYARMHAQVQARLQAPPPNPAEVRRLEVLPQSWAIGTRPAAWVDDEEGTPQIAYIALVMSEDGLIRASTMTSGTHPDAEALAHLVYKAAGQPGAGVPGRPHHLYVAEAEQAAALNDALKAVDIPVEVGYPADVDRVLDEVVTHLTGPVRPVLVDYDEAALTAFLKTARSFFNKRPWRRFDGTKYLGFRIDGGPWGYLSVMGQGGEQFGLSYFEDWFQLCRFLHNQPTMFEAMMEENPADSKPLRAAGAMESVSLDPWDYLHPEDAVYVRTLGLKPLRGGQYPVPRRYLAGGTAAPPLLNLATYGLIMEAITTVLGRRSTPVLTSIKQTIESTSGQTVDLRYPADGTEALDEDTGTVRVVVEGQGFEDYRPLLQPGERIEVVAAAATPFHRLLSPIKKLTPTSGDRFWIDALHDGAYLLWSEYMGGRGGPSPALADLVGREDLALQLLSRTYPLHVERIDDPAPKKPKARLVKR